MVIQNVLRLPKDNSMKSAFKNFWLVLLIYFASSFLLHFSWEMMQAPLYQGFKGSFMSHILTCLFATATGDMLFTAVIYVAVAIALQNPKWIATKQSYGHSATWLLPVLVGILLATSFELWAVYAVERWSYGTMPLIPIVHVGLTPILQMVLIPLLSLSVARYSLAKIR